MSYLRQIDSRKKKREGLQRFKRKVMGRSVSPTHKFIHIQQQKQVKCQVSVKFVSDFMSFSVKLLSMS